MSIAETMLVIASIGGLVFGATAIRHDRAWIGGALVLVSISVATIAAALGNARPIVGLLAFGFFVAAVIAGEKNKQVLALVCFSVAFLTAGIAAMYT